MSVAISLHMEDTFRIVPLGQDALLVEFGNRIDNALHENVMDLFHRLKTVAPFFVDVVPSYASLAVYYDVLSLSTKEKTAYERVKEILLPLLRQVDRHPVPVEAERAIPVCYAPACAPDLEDLAKQKGLTTEDVIRIHTAKPYRVYLLGFLPGFPYLGSVDQRIATPRKSSPRTAVPAGSVGIAGAQTGIYPLASPGGWNIIGRTPLSLFNKDQENPVLLQPGDRVRFYAITEDELNHYQGRVA